MDLPHSAPQAQAAIFTGCQQPFELRDAIPLLLTEDSTIVRVLGCTICGSDLHSVQGRREVATPSVLGHEIVGEITHLGPSAPQRDLQGIPLQVGSRVTWCLVANCGECFYCLRDLPQKCLHGVKYGHALLDDHHAISGGFASHCVLHRQTRLIVLPDELTLAEACPLNCAIATAAAAMESVRPHAELTVAIHGLGLLGLALAAMCRILGAKQILGVDPHPARREHAHAFGVTIATGPETFREIASASTEHHGVDVSLECCGHNSAFTSAFETTRLGGTITLIGGVFPDEAIELLTERIVRRNLTVVGIHNYAPRHLLDAVQFMTRHRKQFEFDRLVTDWYPLEEIDAAFAQAQQAEAIRVGLLANAVHDES